MKTLIALVKKPENSESFIQYAAQMAKSFSAKLNVLYIQSANQYPSGTTDLTGAALAQYKENLDAIIKSAYNSLETQVSTVKKSIGNDTVIEHAAMLGIASRIINELVEDKKADMVVTEGEEKEGFLLQSLGNQDLIKNTNCPVWIIPKHKQYHPFHEIVYATDYKKEDVANVHRLVDLTRHFSPHITALHITDSIDFEEKIKQEGFSEMLQRSNDYEKLSVEAFTEAKENKSDQILKDFAQKTDADLIVMMKEDKSFLERIFTTDTEKKIIENTDVPVLVYHE